MSTDPSVDPIKGFREKYRKTAFTTLSTSLPAAPKSLSFYQHHIITAAVRIC